MIDTHCHLDFPLFDGWRDQAIARARAVGIDALVVPGVTAAHWPRVLELCAQQPGGLRLYPALGLHPCFLEEHRPAHLQALAQQVRMHRQRLVAVGEIGLDFYIKGADRQAQTALLEAQLRIAKAEDLPVLLHVRKAHDQVLSLLRRLRLPRGGIIHAFSGSEHQARQYARLGFRLGFGGAISYSRACKLRRLAAELPLEWLVLETDAPDMPLADARERPNEPAQVARVAAIIAELRGLTPAAVARTTRDTARALLGLDQEL